MQLRTDIALCLVALVLGIAAAASPPAGAAIITFSDRAAFLAATGATSATGPIPNLGAVGTGPTTIGRIVYRRHTNFTVPGSLIFQEFTTRLSGNELAISGTEDVIFETASPVASLGFDFVEPETDPNVNGPFVDSTFAVSLFDGALLVGAFSFNAPNDTAAFVGVSSDLLFNRMEILETIGGTGDEFFGEIVTGPRQTQPVPEPSILALFGFAALGLLLVRRRAGST